MSRTYRKIHPTRDISEEWDIITREWRESTKADIAKIKSDGGPWRHHTKPWMKQVSRKCRQVNREQFAKLKKTHFDDIEVFDFDDSEYQMKRKGIWWEIY